MPLIPGLQAFELVTQRTQTRLQLDGTLEGLQHETEHQVAEHRILGRPGAIHQSNAQGPRRFVYSLLILDDDRGDASDKYKALEARLADDPFGRCIDPRLGGVDYIYRGLKVTQRIEEQINGLMAELRLDETSLRDVKPENAAVTARAALASSEQPLARLGTIIARLNNIDAPSLADLTSGSPLAAGNVPAAVTALISLGATIYSAVTALVTLCDDPTTDQYTLAGQLVEVGKAVEAFAASADSGGDIGSAVSAYLMTGPARLAYAQAIVAYQDAAKQRVPIVPRRVPGKMSLPRFGRYLYGGGAASLEEEILRLNPGRIPYPYALTPGIELLVPDPARVRLD